MRVRNMESRRTGREVANQFIITDGMKKVFQSYDSTIVEINREDTENKTITVYRDWDYSTTTGKYRNQFMEDEGFDEMATKKGFEHYMNLGKIGDYTIIKKF